MGKKGGGGGSTTQQVTQKADPWVGAQPGLSNLYNSASSWYNGGGGGTEGINPNQQAGMSEIMAQFQRSQPQLAQAGNQALAMGQGQGAYDFNGNPVLNGQMTYDNMYANGKWDNADPTASGTYLSEKTNPYLRNMVDAASRPITDNFQYAVAPALASQFSAAGRTGSGAHVMAAGNAEQNLVRQLGDTSSQIYGNAYGQERNLMEQAKQATYQRRFTAYENERSGQRQGYLAMPQQKMQQQALQLQALGLVPSMAQAGYAGAQQVLGVGNQLQENAQAQRDGPMRNLMAYNSVMTGAAPYASSSSTQKASTQQPNNPIMGAMGGALMGSYLGPLMGATGPVGAIGGALLGGLFG